MRPSFSFAAPLATRTAGRHLPRMPNDPRFDLTGKVAVITGATRGIGRAIAFQLGRAGASVVVSSRKAEAVDATVAALAAEMCGPLFAKTTGAQIPIDGGNERVI